MSVEMPEGWEDVSLDDCLYDLRNGWTYDTRATNGTLPITRIETVSNGQIDYARVGYTTTDDRIEAFRLQENDILFSHINSVEHIAKVAIKSDARLLYHGMNLMRLRPNERVAPAFLLARLQSDKTRAHYRAACKRAINQASLNKGEVSGYRFPLPPLDEQRRIAEVLGSVDEAIATAQSALKASQAIHQILLERLFGLFIINASTNGSVGMTIEACCKRVTYGFTNPMPTATDGPWLLTALNIRHGWIDYENARHTSSEAYANLITEKSRPPIGSILVTKDGTLGRVAIVDRHDVCVNQSVAVLSPDCDVIHPPFLSYLLQSGSGQAKMLSESGGSSVKHIYISKLAKMEIGVPTLEVQRENAVLAEESEKAIQAQTAPLRRLMQVRTIIASDLLSGRVRVPA
ncbi:restriction endonuclease subunit S [Mesorhizobium sp.]|uniref:restriction endonuclease subunit S n=1 Tax=Mesorhizobium sp. TaxID=1871066 RepID=UPI0011FA7453|nr:restriction endonuclease subunit S [Mesorhizobium sp.]TIL48848.1 MAG: hypothetical protein E5Y83_29380 [Mesorhizobium sp.]